MGNRYVRLALGCVLLFFAGVIYAWSVLKAPFTEAFGWTGASLSLCFTLTLCFFCLGGLASGLLSRRVSIRARMAAAGVMLLAGFALVSRLQGNILVLYLGYGVLAGAGIGVVYNVVIAVTSAYFPDRKGFASGCMMMTFGFSSLVLGKLASALFALESFGWRTTFLTMGVVIGAFMILGGFLMRAPDAKADAAAGGAGDVATRDMIRLPSFYKLFAFFTLLAAVGSAAIGFGKDFFVASGSAEGAAVTAAGLLSVFNGLGRLSSGWLFDKAGLRRTQFIASGVAILAPLTALISVLTHISALGVIGLSLCAFSYGFSPTLSAALVGAFYGRGHYALNFSVLNLVLIPASFASTLAGSLVSVTGGYVSTFILFTAFSAVGLIINISIRKEH